jgi:hypothetical protein
MVGHTNSQSVICCNKAEIIHLIILSIQKACLIHRTALFLRCHLISPRLFLDLERREGPGWKVVLLCVAFELLQKMTIHEMN